MYQDVTYTYEMMLILWSLKTDGKLLDMEQTHDELEQNTNQAN